MAHSFKAIGYSAPHWVKKWPLPSGRSVSQQRTETEKWPLSLR
ncbi:hypothetical protein [Laspinema olomoucense]|nr:hypothetical protein [Laspinema sp. D3d]